MLPKGEKRPRGTLSVQLPKEDSGVEETSESRCHKALFVKNLPPSTTEGEVMALHPGIQKAKLDVAKNSSKTKYALLDFTDADAAKDALGHLSGAEFNGHKLFVDYLESSAMISYNQSASLSHTRDPLKLYVTGFGQNMTENQLADMFPTASSFKLDLDPYTKKSRGFAFIHFKDEYEAKHIHDSMQDAQFGGMSLVVMYGKNESLDNGGMVHSDKGLLPNKRAKLDYVNEFECELCSDDEEEEDEDEDEEEGLGLAEQCEDVSDDDDDA